MVKVNHKEFVAFHTSRLLTRAIVGVSKSRVNCERHERKGGYNMTDAQIRYRQLVETTKHNRAQEDNWLKSLGETIRHDQAQEQLSKYQTDTQAQTSRYSADTSAAASRYTADTRLEGSKYSADTSAEASTYRTDVEHLDKAAQRRIEKAKVLLDETIRTGQLKLDTFRVKNETKRLSADISKMSSDISIALERLGLEADRLEMDKLRAEVQNALDRAKKWESYSKTGLNAAAIAKTMSIDYDNIMKRIYSAMPSTD